jgi:molybdopterin converting factor small subunit
MRVEFFGVSRERAGIAERSVDARTLGELLATLAADHAALAELLPGNHLHPALAANLNGDRFIRDPHTPLKDDDCVLLLSADAGG